MNRPSEVTHNNGAQRTKNSTSNSKIPSTWCLRGPLVDVSNRTLKELALTRNSHQGCKLGNQQIESDGRNRSTSTPSKEGMKACFFTIRTSSPRAPDLQCMNETSSSSTHTATTLPHGEPVDEVYFSTFFNLFFISQVLG